MVVLKYKNSLLTHINVEIVKTKQLLGKVRNLVNDPYFKEFDEEFQNHVHQKRTYLEHMFEFYKGIASDIDSDFDGKVKW